MCISLLLHGVLVSTWDLILRQQSKNHLVKRKIFLFIIGLIRLKANAKLQNTVCLLCLPERSKDYGGMNCTVTGYGKPSITALREVMDSGNYDKTLNLC